MDGQSPTRSCAAGNAEHKPGNNQPTMTALSNTKRPRQTQQHLFTVPPSATALAGLNTFKLRVP